MIDVQQITKRYGQHTAIDRVTFSVAKGEVLAFLGPNGAGKTTTMRILTCFMPPPKAGHAWRDSIAPTSHGGEATDRLLAGDSAGLSRIDGRRISSASSAGSAVWAAQSSPRHVSVRSNGSDWARCSTDSSAICRADTANASGWRKRCCTIPRSDSGRTDRRPRPKTDHRDPRIDQEPGRIAFRHSEHPHSSRSHRRLPARRHHQRRAHCGRRYA